MSSPEAAGRPDTRAGTEVSCWSTIGVMGDHSCPELTVAIHCRNCRVFAAAARTFLDRAAPAGYVDEWTRQLDVQGDDDADASRQEAGVLVFRLGAEWLALPATVVAEVTPFRPAHRIPHRSSPILVGLVAVRGQLHLCVSLQVLLGTAPVASAKAYPASDPLARMIEIRHDADTWVFAADEVLGVPRVAEDDLRSVPSTLANPTVSFTRAVFNWQGRSVGLLDELRVFAALGGVGQ
jgi:chemotaxis-related protein WspD